MSLNASEIAKYIISKCYKEQNYINNLKLQKILYIVWLEYYKEKGTAIFDNDICAWKMGPIVPDVYYEYCMYAARPIFMDYKTTIPEDCKEICDKVIIQQPTVKTVGL